MALALVMVKGQEGFLVSGTIDHHHMATTSYSEKAVTSGIGVKVKVCFKVHHSDYKNDDILNLFNF